MAKEMIMKALIYNIFTARIRGLPREAGRGRDRWAARRGSCNKATVVITLKVERPTKHRWISA